MSLGCVKVFYWMKELEKQRIIYQGCVDIRIKVNFGRPWKEICFIDFLFSVLGYSPELLKENS